MSKDFQGGTVTLYLSGERKLKLNYNPAAGALFARDVETVMLNFGRNVKLTLGELTAGKYAFNLVHMAKVEAISVEQKPVIEQAIAEQNHEAAESELEKAPTRHADGVKSSNVVAGARSTGTQARNK